MRNNQTVFQSEIVRYELKKKEIDIPIAEDLTAYQEKVFASKNGSLMFKHFRKLKRITISLHLECKVESARSFEARANILLKYFANIYRETSAITMPEYTESGSFDLKICRDDISQIAKKFVLSKARSPDAIPL